MTSNEVHKYDYVYSVQNIINVNLVQWRIQELLVGGMMYPVSYYPPTTSCLLPASPSLSFIAALKSSRYEGAL